MQEGTVLRNNYRLDRLLGRGGMAEVYLAFDIRRHTRVAVKILREDLAEDPEFLRRFTREAEALARLDHPNIVRFYSFERQGAVAFIVMDFVPGTTLQRRLVELGTPLPLDEVSAILGQVGAALQYAHNEGYVHRDIKPGNIMLRDDGTALLSDFGIARAAESATQATMAIGTPAYMAPEQILGRPIDRRADIYSLGVVLFEMCTGQRPFSGNESGLTETSTLGRLREAHLRLTPPDPRSVRPGLSPGVSQVILRALAKDPAQRWPDVLSLVQAWETTTAGAVGLPPRTAAAQVSASRPSTPAGRGSPASAAGWLLPLIGGAVALLAITAIVLLVAGSRNRREVVATPIPATQTRTSGAISRASPSPSASAPAVTIALSTPSPSSEIRRVTPSPTPIKSTVAASPAPPSAQPTTRTATPAPTRSPTPAAARGYTADFSAASGEWQEESGASVVRSREAGRYYIKILDAEMTAWSHPGQSFADFTLEVDAFQAGGPDDNGYGVLLRYIDGDNFYYFEISGDGYWEFTKQEDDEWTTLVEWTPADAIKQGVATNKIKVVCDAGAFTFYVNGVKVGEFFDATFEEGDIGVAASAYETAGVYIGFDNLQVRPLR